MHPVYMRSASSVQLNEVRVDSANSACIMQNQGYTCLESLKHFDTSWKAADGAAEAAAVQGRVAFCS